jgi:hypothetical protein
MTSASGPPVGGVSIGRSNSAAIDILHTNSCYVDCTCRCGCMNCCCHIRVVTIDPNREEYGGEGTLLGIGARAITQPTSYASTSSMDSVKESSGAPAPTATTTLGLASFDTIRDIHGQQDLSRLAENKVAHYLSEAEDECPWRYYLEKSITSDEDAGFFGPVELDDSMRNNARFSSGDQSMLSSFMPSLSPRPPSVGTSDVIRGVGGVFGPRGPMRLN